MSAKKKKKLTQKQKKFLFSLAAIALLALLILILPEEAASPAALSPELLAAAPEFTPAPPESEPSESEPPAPSEAIAETPAQTPAEEGIAEDGVYTSRDDVALYIHTYNRLPSNFITKDAARDLGWSGGSLKAYAPGKCIGGDRFGNYEKLLPEANGRSYTECDIDTLGASSRGAKRIVFSNDGLIFYTDDHYESFTQLY